MSATWFSANSTAIVTWQAPASTGCAPIQGYEVSCISAGGAVVPPQFFAGATTLTTAPTGLTGPFAPDTPYSCTVCGCAV